MKKIILTLSLVSSLTLTACQTNDDWISAGQNILGSAMGQQGMATALSATEMSAGLREALNIGTGIVVNQLGQSGGFNLDPKIKIPLPASLQKVDNALSTIGLGSITKDLESKLNRAAELATPKAKTLFFDAIKSMTITDAKDILFGADNAATTYLRARMGTALAAEMQPIIQTTMNQAGAVQAYDNVMRQYQVLPFMPDVKTELNNYVVDKALDGIFYYVAQEEAAIRNDPAKRTTELLQKVFAQ